MRIQHNIAALNSYRNLTGNNNAVSKNLEKLSSGYRINRAGDDAAGLAISEKMRAQITGLNTAQKNAQDGVSLVQTAEGALTEVHSMLNRMVELADQSANGTYDNAVDRANLQKEIKSLKDEIDRIADSTNFNGINLLDGSLSTTKLDLGSTSSIGGAIQVTQNPATGAVSKIATKAGTDGTEQTLTVEYADENGKLHSVNVKYTSSNAQDKNQQAIMDALSKNSELSSVFDFAKDQANITFTSKVTGEGGAKLTSVKTTDNVADSADIGGVTDGTNATVTAKTNNALAAGDKIVLNGKTYEFVTDAGATVSKGATAVVVGAGENATLANLNKALESEGIKAEFTGTQKDIKFSGTKNGSGLTLQIGDTSADFNQMTVSVGDMHGAALGIADIDISTQAGAKAAVDKIKSAINSVSSTRGDLGAIQNRLEHTINNLSVTAENMTAAESRIRDVDMANEMMAYTKNNILVQSSQAMLAQANQIPQGVLQLLQ
ncbi:flagellin [Faecalimonas mobilis]